MVANIRVGISGWTYPDWRGPFYPDEIIIKDELKYASHSFNSIEINGTFYALQKPHTFEKWYDETPEGFQFAVKAPKYVTHERRLKDVRTPIANFFASGLLALKEKLGPILWQLPPSLKFDAERLENFLSLLPHTTEDACELGKDHSEWMAERLYLKTDKNRPILHCVEVRHESFQDPAFYKLMKKYNVAIVIGDTAGRWPLIKESTGPITYIRLHGDEVLYPDGYPKAALKKWAQEIKDFAEQSDIVYAFCDNDHKIAAPLNAKQLMDILELIWQPKMQPLTLKKTVNKAKAKVKVSKPTANNRTIAKPTRTSRSKNKSLDKRGKAA